MNDLELMRRIAAERCAALKTLVDLHQVKVLNLCIRLLGTRQNAEDVAQEVFFPGLPVRPRIPRGVSRLNLDLSHRRQSLPQLQPGQ